MEKLLDNFGSFNDSLEAFKRGVESGDTLLDLIVENDNEEAWDWVIDYIAEQCENSDYCEPQEESGSQEVRQLVFFCKTYQNRASSDLKDLLDNSFFNDRYGSYIEGLDKCGAGGDEQCDPEQIADFLDISGKKTVCSYLAGISDS